MKIGLVTIHYNYANLGSTLQAYSLVKHLRRYAPEAEVVDHRYPGKMLAVGAPRTLSQLEQFRFIERHVPCSPTFVSDDCKETEHYMAKHYDLLVYGSDEVWKWHIRKWGWGKGRQRTRDQITPVPNIYWPHGVPVPKVSYAATIGKSNTPIPEDLRARLRDSLLEFDDLGVRDRRTEEFVRNLCGRESSIVPDPVFLEDLSDECDLDRVRYKLLKAGAKPGQAIIGYYVHGDHLRGIEAGKVMKGASLLNLKACELTPVEFRNVSKLLSMMISNTHHGTLVAVLNNTPTYIVDPCPPKVKDHIARFGLNRAPIEKTVDKWDSAHVAKAVAEESQIGVGWLKSIVEKYRGA